MAKANDFLTSERINQIVTTGRSNGKSDKEITLAIKTEAQQMRKLQEQTSQIIQPKTTVKEAMQDSIYTDDGIVGDVVRGITTSGIRTLNLADGAANTIGFDLVGNKTTNVLNEALAVMENKKQEISQANVSKERLKELQKLQEQSQNAKGVIGNLKAGVDQMVDVATHPSEWTAQGVTEMLSDPLNALSFGAGSIAGKVGRTMLQKTAVGAGAGIAEGATINSGAEYLISKGQGKSDSEAQKIALQSAGGGMVAGGFFGGAGGASVGLTKKTSKPKLKDVSAEEILKNDLLKKENITANDISNITIEDAAEIDVRIQREVDEKYKIEKAGEQPVKEPDFILINENLPATLNELVEVEIIEPKVATQIEYKNKMIMLGHKDVIYADFDGWKESVGQDVIDAINAKKLQNIAKAEGDAETVALKSSEIAIELAGTGADAVTIKDTINQKLLPSRVENELTLVLNDGVPLENRFSGLRLKTLIQNTIKEGGIDPNVLSASLTKAGVSKNLHDAVVQSVLNKNVEHFDEYVNGKLTNNLDKENKQIKEVVEQKLLTGVDESTIKKSVEKEEATPVKEVTEEKPQVKEVKEETPPVKETPEQEQTPVVDETPQEIKTVPNKHEGVKFMEMTDQQREDRREYHRVKEDYEFKIYNRDWELVEDKLIRSTHKNQIIELDEHTLPIAKEIWDTKAKEDTHKARYKNYEPIKDIDTDISYNEAYAAHTGTSFSPEQRAKSTIADHIALLTDDYETLLKITTDDKIELLNSEFTRYRTGLTKRKKDLLSRKSRTYSAMIAGPANFPRAKMEKLNGYVDNAMGEYVNYREKALRSIRNKLVDSGIIKSDDPEAITKLKEKIETLTNRQEKMKQANKILRSKKSDKAGKLAQLKELELTDDMFDDIKRFGGFQHFQLTNNNAKIKTAKQRLVKLEREFKEAEALKSSGEVKSIDYIGASIVDNLEAKRVQILFEDIPNAEIRTELKKNGFKWSPRNKAWQRGLSSESTWKAQRVLDQFLEKKQGDEIAAKFDDQTVNKYTNESVDPNTKFDTAIEKLREC